MIEFSWFYVLKFLVIAVMVLFITKPFYKEFKKKGFVSPSGKKIPVALAFLLGVLLAFNPIKIDNSTSADLMRQSYDKPVEQNIEEIRKHELKEYSPNDNEEQIKRILED